MHSRMGAEDRDEDRSYQAIIDTLVHVCRKGQGQIGPNRARAGLWNANATPDLLPEQHEVNVLLARISNADREILARMLQDAFEGGVHATLAALHEAGLIPLTGPTRGRLFTTSSVASPVGPGRRRRGLELAACQFLAAG
jgi:hypothetical protein